MLLYVDLVNPPRDDLRQAGVYFLFEHKSQSDPLTVFQLLSYIVRIWEKRLRDGQGLCPIIPLVVYHGENGWTADRELAGLISAPAALAKYQVSFQFPLLDLSRLSDEEIAGQPILQSTLRLLKYSRSKVLVSKLGEILHLISRSLPAGRLPDWIQAIGVYVMSVNKNIDSQQFKQTLKSVFPTQFEPGSLADRLLIQGREEGREEGLKSVVATLRMLEELLSEPVSSVDKLMSEPLESLTSKVGELQQRLRARHV